MQSPRGPAVKEGPLACLKDWNLTGNLLIERCMNACISFQSALKEDVLVICRQVFHRWAPPPKKTRTTSSCGALVRDVNLHVGPMDHFLL